MAKQPFPKVALMKESTTLLANRIGYIREQLVKAEDAGEIVMQAHYRVILRAAESEMWRRSRQS
jgi:hypothetical protein